MDDSRRGTVNADAIRRTVRPARLPEHCMPSVAAAAGAV